MVFVHVHSELYMYTLKVRGQCSVHENCTVYKRFLQMNSSSSDTKMAQYLKPFLRYIVTTAVIFYIAEGQNVLGKSQQILPVKFNFTIIRECQNFATTKFTCPSIGIQT